jgi:hypothetical protein
MITIDLDDFMFELKDGALKHVGASNRSATAKLYDVEEAAVTEFGDERVKLSCEDDDGNEVEIALSPDIASQVADRIDTLEDESEIFE